MYEGKDIFEIQKEIRNAQSMPKEQAYKKALELAKLKIHRSEVAEELRKNAACETVVEAPASILLVGDRVNFFSNQPGAPYGWGTVVCVTDKYVEAVRPYVHTGDFTMGVSDGYTGKGWGMPKVVGEKILSFMGQETIKLWVEDNRPLSVVFRSSVPK